MATPITSSDFCQSPDGELSHHCFMEEEVRDPLNPQGASAQPWVRCLHAFHGSVLPLGPDLMTGGLGSRSRVSSLKGSG